MATLLVATAIWYFYSKPRNISFIRTLILTWLCAIVFDLALTGLLVLITP